MKNEIGLLALSFFLSGCIPAMNTILPASERSYGKTPNHNVVVKAEIGESIYSEFDYSVSPKATVLNTSVISGNKIIENTELSGTQIDGKLAFCISTYNYQSSWYPCFMDHDNDGIFDKYTNLGDGFDNSFRDIGTEIKYKKSLDPLTAKTGFKKELIYQGSSNGKLSIAYREFTNDMARPAYSQNIDYDLDSSGSTVIGFKGARINVIKASGIFIEYKVVSGFK